jgi:hypothetical protein
MSRQISPLWSALPIQDVKKHEDNTAQQYGGKDTSVPVPYIGGTTVYFLNRQGGSNLQIFLEAHITLLVQKVN